MQVLEAPARFHEFDGQPVEQRMVSGRGRPQAEVVRRGDQRLAEVPRPDVIDGDAGRQRVRGGRRSSGPVRAAGPVLTFEYGALLGVSR